MAEFAPPPWPRPRPPPPPVPRADRSNGERVWVPPRPPPPPQGPFPVPAPAPGYGWINPPPPPVTGYRPYGPGPCFFGVRPYGYYGYQYQQCLRPPAQLAPPQVNLNVNAFVENIGKVDSQTSIFALARRGTGVFHPEPRAPSYNRPGKNNRGLRQKQGTWRSRNASKGNDGSVKQEECNPHTPTSEMGLPKEWTY